MPTAVLVALITATAFYVAVQLVAVAGWWRVRRTDPPAAPDDWPTVSVVVPARDEADQIEACIDSILACDYPEERLEIIVVDDFSTDGTAARVRAARPTPVEAGAAAPLPDAPTVRLLQMGNLQAANGGHKPAAVARGVEAARGDVILTTDADCAVAPGWIRSMVRRCTPETPFVAGVVRYRYSHRYFERLQGLAFAGLVAFGAGTLGAGVPTYCNSANVAFRRDVLDLVTAATSDDASDDASEATAADAPSGDGAVGTAPAVTVEGAARDEMLLQYVAYATDRSVAFNPDPGAAVTTEPAPSWSDYLHQQARWASMGARYPFALPRLLVVGMWAVHPLLLAALLAAVAIPSWREPALAALLGKMAVDLLLTVPFAKHLGVNDLTRSTVATEALLLVVVPLAGVLGSFGALEWKGRTLQE